MLQLHPDYITGEEYSQPVILIVSSILLRLVSAVQLAQLCISL